MTETQFYFQACFKSCACAQTEHRTRSSILNVWMNKTCFTRMGHVESKYYIRNIDKNKACAGQNSLLTTILVTMK